MAHCSSSLNVPNKLISSLFAQKNTSRYCDITLKFGEVELRAHSCVVAAFSPFVDKLLSSGEVIPLSTETRSRTEPCLIPLSDAQFKCLDCATKVIDFMYRGKIQVDDIHLEHIKAVSESLQVSELLKICRKHSEKFCERINSTDDCQESLTSSAPLSGDSTEEEPKVQSKPVSLEQELLSTEPTSLQRSNTTKDVSSLPIISTPAGDDMDESEWSGMKCPKCDLILMSLALYQQHCGTHLGKTYTACYVCNYASIRVPDVIKHLQEMNHGEKVCSICLLEVSCSQSLQEHIQIHDQAQPFFCLTCRTRFQTRTALNSHIVRHTNETPFICKECGRGFKWKHGLRSHMVIHSKLKSFLCDQCGFSTAHLRSFIDHKAAHSGEKFKCPKPDCQFSSVRRASVKHHLMTHSKQKPYQCEVCGQAFSQNKNLRRHAAFHNPSADPEKCPLCSYQTNRSDKFKAHFKRYHKDGERLEEPLETKRNSSSTKCALLPKPFPDKNNVDDSVLINGGTVNNDSTVNSHFSSLENSTPVPKRSKGHKSLQCDHLDGIVVENPAESHNLKRIHISSSNKNQRQISKGSRVDKEFGKQRPGLSELPLAKLPSKKRKHLHRPPTSVHHGEVSDNMVLQVSDPISNQFVLLNTSEALSSSDALYTLSDGTYVIMDAAKVDDLSENLNSVDVPTIICEANTLNLPFNESLGSMGPSLVMPMLEIFDNATVTSIARNKS